jgi:hypothetical protein
LLDLIQKGVTVAQVAQVTRNFTEAGIMVHAYLMYGFPTQTAQETIDSLEMVRQMFEAGILQSGFWHQFAMTAHSPVGMHPELFGVKRETDQIGSFANNDLVHLDPSGTDHEAFSFGLKKSLLNFMHGIGLDFPLQDWFEHRVPRTRISKNYIAEALEEEQVFSLKPSAKLVWLGTKPKCSAYIKTKKGKQWEMLTLTFQDKKETFSIQLDRAQGEWVTAMLQKISVSNSEVLTFQEVKWDYETSGLEDFELFWFSRPVRTLSGYGLLAL